MSDTRKLAERVLVDQMSPEGGTRRTLARAYLDQAAENERLRETLRTCVQALMRTDITKPEGSAQADWQSAITQACEALDEDLDDIQVSCERNNGQNRKEQ